MSDKPDETQEPASEEETLRRFAWTADDLAAIGATEEDFGKAFDPDQPRDDAGRWSSGGGSGGSSGGEGGKPQQDEVAHAPARAPRGRIGSKIESWDVTAQVEEVAKSWGYPKDKIKWDPGQGHEFEVDGETMTAAAYCDLKSGNVTIYTESLTEGHDDPIELAAHEIMHGVFEHCTRQYEIEETAIYKLEAKGKEPWDEKGNLKKEFHDEFPVVAEMSPYFNSDAYDKFAKEDGVTDYSKAYWKEQKAGVATRHIAIHETLAEIAAHEARTGKVIGKPHYKNAYAAVKNAWVASGSKKKKKDVGEDADTTIVDGPPRASRIEYSDVAVFVNRAFTVVPKEEADYVVMWNKDGTLTYGLKKPDQEASSDIQ
jgi:hypothetical protein